MIRNKLKGDNVNCIKRQIDDICKIEIIVDSKNTSKPKSYFVFTTDNLEKENVISFNYNAFANLLEIYQLITEKDDEPRVMIPVNFSEDTMIWINKEDYSMGIVDSDKVFYYMMFDGLVNKDEVVRYYNNYLRTAHSRTLSEDDTLKINTFITVLILIEAVYGELLNIEYIGDNEYKYIYK